MLLKELVSSAKISWCPSPNRDRLSLLALGGCGLSPCLSVGLIDITNSGKDIENIGTSPLSSRCTSIAWGSYNSEEGALGLICTGMEDGNMGLFRPVLSTYDGREGGREVVLERLCEATIHPSAVGCLEFNRTDHHLLASGGNDGKVYVVDLSDGITGSLNYFEPGKENKHGDYDVTSLKWNPKVPHIMASSSSNGNTAIWDLKMKKSAISFRDPAQRSRPSTLAWVPNQPTQIVVGYDDDRNPSLQLWDLRNVSYPFKEAVSAHQKGVMSIEFSPIDPNLLLPRSSPSSTPSSGASRTSGPRSSPGSLQLRPTMTRSASIPSPPTPARRPIYRPGTASPVE
ncbi:WD repeat protein [Cryptosporidium canis]|uniref:WD repeat protein n=1 Tax=Cryptosporidium canis TaxID=195482 RepID=A0A9D5DGT0_9CRYT|nr:WD repeat protein [Cryptosporidium canis]